MKTEVKVDMYKYENALRAKGFAAIAGVDEAGRGPLAGSVFAAAVILPEGEVIEGLNDSKKLSEKKREALFDVIQEKAVAYCVCAIDHEEIDRINILEATFKAMNGAVQGLKVPADFVLIDGNRIRGMDYVPHQTVVKGDALSASIAAASILAKVSRDREMIALAKQYPEYEFEKHKAYPTERHRALIAQYGPSPIHRKTFRGVKEFVK